jgi:hypothetical protein
LLKCHSETINAIYRLVPRKAVFGQSNAIMKQVISLLSVIIWWGSGIVIWGLYVTYLVDWLGFVGGVIGIFIAPGAILFPFVYWIAEGAFPVWYFGLLAVSLAAMFVKAIIDDE